MFPGWKYSLFQSWFRRTLAFQKPLAFLGKIINCFTNIFDSKQLKYSPKVYIFALRRENGNLRRNEPLFLVSVDKLPTCYIRVNNFDKQVTWYRKWSNKRLISISVREEKIKLGKQKHICSNFSHFTRFIKTIFCVGAKLILPT
jgi:hypothetical protein